MNLFGIFGLLCVTFVILMGVTLWCISKEKKYNIPLLLAYAVLFLLLGNIGSMLIAENPGTARYDIGLILFDNFIGIGVFGFLLFVISYLWTNK